jgi:RNA 3'-terminal phosphate cyclase (ATP)
MIEIDGSQGEGGGQVLRSSLSLSLVTGEPVRLFNIRSGRDKPGLQPQHLQAVKAAARVGGARAEGAELDSQSLVFAPSGVRSGDFAFDIGTAGSIALVLQTILLPLSLAQGPSRVRVTGGTHVRWSPCFHYLDWHWRRFMEKAGYRLTLWMERAGFYPPGGGVVHAGVVPTEHVRALTVLERGALMRVRGISAVANLPRTIAERQKDQALRRLLSRFEDIDIQIVDLPAFSKGTLLLLMAEFEHSQSCHYSLGERGKPAERVANEAVDDLERFLAREGAVDAPLADQLILPLALAEGTSSFRTAEVTSHLITNTTIVRRFLPGPIEIEGDIGRPGVVRVTGTGWRRRPA